MPGSRAFYIALKSRATVDFLFRTRGLGSSRGRAPGDMPPATRFVNRYGADEPPRTGRSLQQQRR